MSDDVENQRITIVPTQSRRRDQTGDHVTLMTRRTLSIHAPPTVQPSARLPIEFRTLSLHLEHTKKSDHSGSNKGSKGAVRGRSGPPVRVRKMLTLPFFSLPFALVLYSRPVGARLAPCVGRRGASQVGGSAEDRARGRPGAAPRRAIRCQSDIAAAEAHAAQGRRLGFWRLWQPAAGRQRRLLYRMVWQFPCFSYLMAHAIL